MVDSSAPLRIMLGIESSGPGGAENMVLGLAQALRAAGDMAGIFTTSEGWLTSRARSASIPVWIMPERPGVDFRWIARLARLIRRERIDVFHGHEFIMNTLGSAAAFLSCTPVVATVHGRHWIAERARRIAAYRTLLAAGMPLVAVSEDLADFIAQRLRVARTALSVVPNGIELVGELERSPSPAERMAARASFGLHPAAPLIVAVGNLYPVKDHATLLRALVHLRAPIWR